jgi:hypothetical protein
MPQKMLPELRNLLLVGLRWIVMLRETEDTLHNNFNP